jgi:hypothetical protein
MFIYFNIPFFAWSPPLSFCGRASQQVHQRESNTNSALILSNILDSVETRVGNGISFRKKFCRIDSEGFPLFRGRKCSFRGLRKSQFRSSEWNDMKKIGFTKNPALANRIYSVFSSETCFGIPGVCFYFCSTE